MRGGLLAASTTLLLVGCAAFPGAESAGRRLAADAFVVLTSPVQIPAMAARDAWHMAEEPVSSTLLFPFSFSWQVLRHGVLTLTYAADLTAAPLHLFNDREPPRIYQAFRWPMPMADDAAVAAEAGETALWFTGMWGGSAVAYWFVVFFIPALFTF